MIEGVLGVEAHLRGLRIRADLPRDWTHVHLKRRFRGATYDIIIRRGTGAQPGCSVNGAGWQAEFLPIAAAGTTQRVEIVV